MDKPRFDFDSDLREVPLDELQFRSYIVYLRRSLHEIFDPAKHVPLLLELADLLRIANRLDEAAEVLQQAATVSRDCALGIYSEANIRLHLARVWQRAKSYERSTREFSKLISLCEVDNRLGQLRDHIWMAAGRNFLEQGQFTDAVVAFEWALALREENDSLNPQDVSVDAAGSVDEARAALARAHELLAYRLSS